jgi:hypothetical protein
VIGSRYRLQRKLLAKSKDSKVKATNTKELESQEALRVFIFHWNPQFLLLFNYDFNIVKEALEFIISDKEKRRSNRKKISLEADGLEIVKDDEEIDKDNEYDDDN